MDISAQFVHFALLGQDWVLWLLVGLSVISVGVMVERALYFRRQRIDPDALEREVKKALSSGDLATLEQRYGHSRSMAAQVALTGVRSRDRGADASAEAMNAARSRVRQAQEQGLVVLGTLGNNSPFIGLFGTVLGIIRAFRDLSANMAEASGAVMAGIAEALLATAVGLLVAIPAVIAYNVFKSRVKEAATGCELLARVVLSNLKAVEPGRSDG